MKEYFTGNFFANTPDILPPILQFGGRPAFIMRAVLAATLSSVYGIYSGYELCENEADSGQGGIPGLGEVRDQGTRLGMDARKHRPDHYADQPDPSRLSGPAHL